VAKDQLLARIECDDIAAEIAQRTAEQAAAAAVLERLNNGNRLEDIAAGAADLALSEARSVEAEAAKNRASTLVPKGGASLSQALTAERDARMASAQVKIAESRLALLKAGPRVEEIAEAKARLQAMQHTIAVAGARLRKCEIRSPVDATVLKKYMSKGELVSIYNPKPIFLLAPTDRYRVRAEVDENDISSVQLGQPVTVVVAPPSDRRIPGKVVEIGNSMGRRQILTNDPAEKSDRDVLEIVVDVESDARALPIGLRVAVLFQGATQHAMKKMIRQRGGGGPDVAVPER
jgi:HlyD family secretion protein